jgi:hypothetical protein
VTIKRRDFDVIERKLELRTVQGDHRHAFFYYGGRWITRTMRSEKRGDLPHSDRIRQQLKLSETQLADLIRCAFDRDNYIQLLEDRGLIPDEPERG